MQEVRLIDADALYRKVKTECNPYGKPTIGFDDGKKVLELIDATPTIESAPKWIPCSERLPEPLINVIVCTDIKTVTLAWLMYDNWYFADTGNGHIEQWGMSDVTHWMPLPEPQKDGGESE